MMTTLMHTVVRHWLRCLFVMVLIGSLNSVQANQLTNYIIGGQAVSSDAKYPFMASIYLDATGGGEFRPSCGGSLIAERWILTAAHCLMNSDFNRLQSVDRMRVLLGTTNLAGDSGTVVEVNRIIVHPDYDSVSDQNDIGLVELAQPFPAPVVVLPSLNSPVPVVGEPGIVLGWGATNEGGSISARLREVALPVFNNVGCFQFYTQIFDSRVAFCAGGSQSGGEDSCQGDSGGPLLVLRDNTYVIAGIVSYGDGCARAGVPGVYTRVEVFADWITANATNTIQYVDEQNTLSVDDTLVTRLAVNTSTSGEVLAGQVAYFDVTGSRQVNLNSIEGDADLYIINDEEFQDISIDLLQCASRVQTSLDVCAIDDTANAYAVVVGFSDASYTISTQLVSNGTSVQPFGTGSQSDTNGSYGLGSVSTRFVFLLFIALCFRRKL